jgi:hypothetical protein
MANQRGSGVPISPFEPQVSRDRQLIPNVVPALQAPEVASAVTQRMADRVGALADQLAQDAGTRAGLAAGADPGFRPTNGFTIRDRAFDRAATDTYISNLSARFSSEALDIFDKHKDDPAGLKAAYDGLVQTYRQRDVFPEIDGAFTAQATTLGTTLRRSALSGWETKTKDQQQAALIGDLSTRDAAGQRLIALDPHAPEAEASYMRLKDENVANIRGLIASGALTSVQGEKMIIDAEQNAQVQLAMARASTLPTSTDVETYRQQLRQKFGAGGIPGLTDWPSLDAALSSLATKKRTETDAALRTYQSDLNDYLSRAQTGAGSPSDWAMLEARAQSLGPAALQAADLTRRKLAGAKILGSLPPDEAAAYLDGLRQQSRETAAGTSSLRPYLTPDKDNSAVDRLAPGFQGALATMLGALPPELQGKVRIYSGYRTVERQAELWQDALKKYGSAAEARKWVAPPGRSNHNHGVAVDLKFGSDDARKWVHDNADRFGLTFRLSNEDWHIEPKNVAQSAVAGGADFTNPPGLVERGNIDLLSRPVVRNPDGSVSTVRSLSFEEDGKEILIPTVSDDGKLLSDQEAIDQFHQTGRHLGMFDSVASADAYAQALHQQQEALYSRPLAATAANAELIDYLEKLDNQNRQLVSTDPLAAAAQNGMISAIVPVDFAAGTDEVAAAFKQRVAQADAVASAYRRAPQYIRPEEKAVLVGRIQKGGDEALSALMGVIKGAGTATPAVLKEISVDAPAMAHAALVAMSTGDITFSRQVAEAEKMRAEGGALPQPDAGTVDPVVVSEIGTALGSLDPAEMARTRAAALDWATVQIARRGLDAKASPEVSNIIQEALQRARGQTRVGDQAFGGVGSVSYGGGYFTDNVKVQLPPDVKSDRFEDVLNAITDDDLAKLQDPPVSPDGKPLKAADLRRNAPFFAPGGYLFGMPDPATGGGVLVMARSGAPFALPFDQLRPTLRSRVPDAFR